MNIAISLNKKYYRYTYVMLTSLYRNHDAGSISLHVLHNDLGQTEQDGLTALSDEYGNRILFFPIHKEDFPSELPVNDLWSLETYFRLKLLDILPNDVERILYLDVDVIVNKNLTSLYHTDFESYHFVVCRDMGINEPFTDIRKHLFNTLMENGFAYFNAGVMLWNVEVLRKTYSFQHYLDLAKELNYQILAPDQDLLNYSHYNQVKYTDEYCYDLFARFAYNLGIHYEQVKEETAIIHYTGYKPWSGEYIHYNIEKLWWDYAKLTPYYLELLEEFSSAVLTNPLINNTIKTLSNEKVTLTNELLKSQILCKKLTALLQ